MTTNSSNLSIADHAIFVQAITKRFGNFTAVDHVNFEVNRGEIFSLLGPNGAGKTTIIRMILDILRPDDGQIQVLGGALTDATKDRIGYLPEERGLYKNVKVLEMLIYLGQLKGMSTHDVRGRALDLLERFGLSDNTKSKISQLSKGMQQKVQIIATILHKPELLIIDEPFSGLDPVNTQLIQDLLYEMKAEGVTIVMSTHQMHQVEEMADRLLMINKGQRVLYGPVKEVRQTYAQNAVIVEGEGNWTTVPGVKEVLAGRNGHEAKLMLASGFTPDDVMQILASRKDYTVRRFELAVPSLNEIFIQVVGGNGSRAEARFNDVRAAD
ncbi:MAG: ABC transporter ATP-binding protein [Chloroflexota bacterium]|nr:ATP-binding cassette domain-containing protein [Chloroflexota bacterium]NOG66037.1 ATP-binding cassette domain-containing protein [Chloroflexota bacterium]GIK67384.1 MAG: ABC transporter ATP-binding protein [Chloroflexota bacterium]